MILKDLVIKEFIQIQSELGQIIKWESKFKQLLMKQLSQQQQKKLFELHLNQQQRRREAKVELKKLQEIQKKNPEEHMLYIQKQFKAKSETVDAAIKNFKQKKISFNELLSEYNLTKQYYVNVSYALKTYDRQFYKEALDKMYNTIIDLKKKYEPRKKFKFSRRQEDFGVKAEDVKEETAVEQIQHNNIPGIQEKNNQTIILKDNGDKLASFKVVSCSDTMVQIHHKTEILFMKNLKNCTIKAALTKSTVFVDHCQGCTFEVSCHQLRIHNTHNSTFGIFVTSKAIIEDSTKIIFTPYTYNYEHREKDEQEFERKGKQNQWRQIQDFNWLKQNQKSPNFDLVQ